jgi:hypothetical protein
MKKSSDYRLRTLVLILLLMVAVLGVVGGISAGINRGWDFDAEVVGNRRADDLRSFLLVGALVTLGCLLAAWSLFTNTLRKWRIERAAREAAERL